LEVQHNGHASSEQEGIITCSAIVADISLGRMVHLDFYGARGDCQALVWRQHRSFLLPHDVYATKGTRLELQFTGDRISGYKMIHVKALEHPKQNKRQSLTLVHSTLVPIEDSEEIGPQHPVGLLVGAQDDVLVQATAFRAFIESMRMRRASKSPFSSYLIIDDRHPCWQSGTFWISAEVNNAISKLGHGNMRLSALDPCYAVDRPSS